MKKECKHPITSLDISLRSDSSPDGWGGTDTWNWMELTCSQCKASKEITHHTFSNVYREITGRNIDFKEASALFLKNKHIYDLSNISNDMNDRVLRSVGKRTDSLAKKIERKKKLIKKHKAELESMLSDFNGGHVSYIDLNF